MVEEVGVSLLIMIIFNGTLLSLCKIEYGYRTIDSIAHNKDYYHIDNLNATT